MVIRCEAPTIRTGTTLTSELEEMVPVLIDTPALAGYDHLILSILRCPASDSFPHARKNLPVEHEKMAYAHKAQK